MNWNWGQIVRDAAIAIGLTFVIWAAIHFCLAAIEIIFSRDGRLRWQ
jgi:hypothetical protein